MPSVPRIITMRNRRRSRKNRNPSGRLGLGCLALMSIIAAITLLLAAGIYTTMVAGLPSLSELPHLLDPPHGLLLQPTRIYDRTGEHILFSLENPAASQREFLTLDDSQENFLPPSLVLATIAASDPSFWQNPGFTIAGVTRQDHPTLAQRLVSELMLWDQPAGIKRSLQERFLAAQITRRYGREKILTWYLNSADYGRLTYGAEAAAQVYFGKPAVQLNLAESALLAVTAEAPALNPHVAPEIARQRAMSLLDVMSRQGLISKEQVQKAKDNPLTFKDPVAPETNPAPAFVNLALREASETIPLKRLERGGFDLVTTLDYELQVQSACAAGVQLARVVDSDQSAVEFNAETCQAGQLLPTLPQRGEFPPQNPGAEVAILDPSLGQVLALTDSSTPKLEPGQTESHPLGSLLTPFVYLTGFTRGMSPGSLVWDIPNPNSEPGGDNPGTEYHGPVRLRIAMANDYLAPVASTMTQVGPENVKRTLIDLGLDANLPVEDSSILQLDYQGSLLEISHAYSTFANMGTQTGRLSASGDLEPISILKISDAGNEIWYELESAHRRPVITPQLAFLVNDILSDEAARWPSLGHPNALEIGRPAAAKIGRTSSANDTWTLGYTPQLVVGVWVGDLDSHSSAQISPQASMGLWHAMAQYATRDLPPISWEQPPGLSVIGVCDPSGMLPTPDCPTVVNEVFPAGSEPTHSDTLYQTLQVNRETGRLATIFTAPDMIEERVYLMVPPEAAEWARQAGLPIPPDEFDVIMESQPSPNVQISSPKMFNQVRGEISILGTAAGQDFDRYNLQIGAGLNPKEWLLVGQPHENEVSEGELGRWNTEGLNGLYVIQLQVIHLDQGIETTAIQVTVDNTPPEVGITYPGEGQEFNQPGTLITFRGQATDNLELDQVEFYLDGELVSSLVQAPFSAPALVNQGDHTLRMVGSDRAGNITQDQIEFTVAK